MAFGLDDALSFGASLFTGAANNRAASQRQDDAQSFSAQQYATRYQTTVKDMESAGLNPMLAYGQGAGNSPTSSAASSSGYGDGGATLNQSRLASAQVANIAADTANKQAQADNIQADTQLKRSSASLNVANTTKSGADADLSRASISNLEFSSKQSAANTEYLNQQASRVAAEIKNIPKEGNRLDALVRTLGAEYENILARTHNVQTATEQLKWLAVKTMHESDLAGLDVQAAQGLGNIGREAGQLKPVVDVIRSLLRK
ncbi:pilot protein [Microviridae sp.]|nr:pilot protein [Microviridae sp.]